MSSRARRRTATAWALVALGLILVVAGSGSGLPSYRPGLAQGAATCGSSVTTVCVQPASQVVDAGAPFTVDVVVDNVTNLGAYQLTLSFDASVISFLGGGNTSFLGSSGRDVSCLGPTASGGSVSMSCVTTSPTGPPGPQGPSGSGALASLQFSGAVPGSSPLDLSEVILTDIAANPTFAGTQNGTVTIVEGPTPTPCPGGVCPTPTATPTPTPTATPSGSPTTVRIDPPSQTQPEGASFSVSVVVDNVVNLGSYQFTLAFDNLQLEFISVNNGTFLGSTGRTVFCPSPIVGENTVSVGCVTSSEAPPGPTGSGVLAEISFRAVSGALVPTPTLLHLFSVEVSDPLANDIPAVVQDGTVTIEAPTPTPCPDGVCPPTATPTPMPSPTAVPTPYPARCLAGSGADVCVKPEALNVSAGDAFSVDMVADDVTNLGGYTFTLVFDPNIIAYNSVTNGPFLGSSGRNAECLTPAVGPTSVTLTCATTGPAPPGAAGSGILATATFTALAQGTSALSLHDVTLTDIVGTVIPSAAHPGTVTVLPGPVPTPTVTTTAIPTPTPGPAAALVWIDPATQTVAPATSPAIGVRIDNVTNLGSYEWQIAYDPSVLSFVSVVNGSFLGSSGRSVFCPNPILDVGTVRFGCVTAGLTPPGPTGSGVLSTVTFSALTEGASPLNFNFVSLSDPLANDIFASSQNGQVVVSAATPTPVAGGAAVPPAGSGRSKSLPAGALIGSVFAGVGFVLLASDLLTGLVLRRRREGQRTAGDRPTGEAANDAR